MNLRQNLILKKLYGSIGELAVKLSSSIALNAKLSLRIKDITA